MPKVSVIMAAYNHEKYVGQAVQSVLDQTYRDFELVITDDASTDRTVREITRFDDARIRFFPLSKNRGQFVATNHCLRQATGEYIAVLNSDDMFLPLKLQRQVQFLEEHPEVGAVFCGVRTIDEHSQRARGKKVFLCENRSRAQWLSRFFYKDNRLCHPSVLMRRRCHEVVGAYNECYAQLADYDLWIRLCMRYEIHILPEELVAFRVLPRNANMSGRRPDSIKRRWWEHRRILNNFLSIQDPGFFLQVFPEAGKYGHDLPETLLPFVLARLALAAKSRRQAHQAFALDTIYHLLSDPHTAGLLQQRFGFDYKDFITLTGQCDIFNAFAIRQMRARRWRLRSLWDAVRRRFGGFRSRQ
jgi:glycosyltransferase involved in cell wall biosynthesis